MKEEIERGRGGREEGRRRKGKHTETKEKEKKDALFGEERERRGERDCKGEKRTATKETDTDLRKKVCVRNLVQYTFNGKK